MKRGYCLFAAFIPAVAGALSPRGDHGSGNGNGDTKNRWDSRAFLEPSAYQSSSPKYGSESSTRLRSPSKSTAYSPSESWPATPAKPLTYKSHHKDVDFSGLPSCVRQGCSLSCSEDVGCAGGKDQITEDCLCAAGFEFGCAKSCGSSEKKEVEGW